MSADFPLDHHPLASDARFQALAGQLGQQTHIDSRASFNRYCRSAIDGWRALVRSADSMTVQFPGLMERVRQGGENVIQTSWGGVVVTRHEHPEVEKFLVIRQGGYLALEKHELKDEQLEVREGAGLLLWRGAPTSPLTVQAIGPGDRFHFQPGMEHCLIGVEALLVFERSIDPKGMDQDLIFLYEPEPAL